MFLSFLLTDRFLIVNFMYDSLIAMMVGTIFLLITRYDLIEEIFLGGVIFAIFYILIFGLLLKLDPAFLAQWSLANLTGKFILGIPVEEIAWAYLFGSLWAPIFEDINDYKLVQMAKGKYKG